MPEPAFANRWSMLIFLVVWLLSCIYVGLNLNHGWDPHDEGTLGQSAERVLNGEMPHRDFDDPYTGGLAYIDAAIFKLFGINLFWLRLFLFVCFLIWVPAVYALAREFLSPLPAGAATLICVGWSVPNYTAAMPSWFNLFFATFGILALAKYIRKPAIHWLILAGLCGGLSFLVKSVALYYVAGALLFFVYREQSLSRIENGRPRRTPLYLAFLALCLSVFVLGLIKLVLNVGEFSEYLHFVFPGTVIALLLVYGERTSPKAPELYRFAALAKMAIPFLLAAAVPVALFCIFYWRHDALAALMNGLFVAPFRRLLITRFPPTELIFEYPSVLGALLILEAANLRGQPRRVLSIFLAVLAAIVLLGSRSNDLAYIISLTSAIGIIPVLVLAGLVVLSTNSPVTILNSDSDQMLFLLLSMSALFSLIQFPYSSVGYFLYVAPIAILLAAVLLSRFSRPPRIILGTAFAFYLLFPVLVIRPHLRGAHKRPDPDDTVLKLPRVGGLKVPRKAADEYLELIPFVRNAAGGDPIFAGPDCPEIYFLTGSRNSTPIIFDSLQDPREYEKEMKLLFERPNFLKVAVTHDTDTTAAYQAYVLRSLAVTRFPNSRKIGSFTVYWDP
jgi:4-amino-4-deoxy-L-arabinose transferase-like glycosyltransferase